MNTPIWATEADIEAARCGYPDIQGYERPWKAKLIKALPFTQKTKSVKNGVVLGVNPYTNDILMHDGPENVLVMGPPRCGKIVSTIIPTSLLWQRSFFSFEQRSDLWEITAAHRKNTLGQRVLKFSPQQSDSAKWNPVEEIRWGTEGVFGDLCIFVDSIIHAPKQMLKQKLSVADAIYDQASSYLLVLVTYLYVADPLLKGTCPCMSDILTFIEGKQADEIFGLLQSCDGILAMLQLSFSSSIFLESFWENEDSWGKDVPWDDIVHVLEAALEPYRRSWAKENTSSSDFHIMDLFDVNHPLSIYYCLEGAWDFRGIASLFVNMLLYKSSSTGNDYEKLLIMLDDVSELSLMGIMDTAFKLSTEFGVRICLVVHDTKQLEGLFGRGNQIAQHCGVHVYFRTDPFCGESTLAAIPNLSVGKVITPEELLRLDLDKVIVFIEGHQPILARKLRYFDNPWLKKMSEVKL